MQITPAQSHVCHRFGVDPTPPLHGTMIGLALSRDRSSLPLNAVRYPPVKQTNGWYVWHGEDSIPEEDTDFFSPIHIEHIMDFAPELAPYLALPPGWAVLLAPEQEDVWYEQSFLER